MKKFKAVLFDMDGVIVDSMKQHAYCWKKVISDYSLDLEDVDILKREGMSGAQSVHDIFIEKNMSPPDDEEIEKLMNRKHALFQTASIALFSRAHEIFSFLFERGIKLGIVTGSLRSAVDQVLGDNMKELVQVIITSDDVQNGKPHPEPYLRAMDITDVQPQETLVIENAPMGVKSAKNAGLACYALETTLHRKYLFEADKIFSDHDALYSYFTACFR